jgi:oligopeptide/dipeptide ABC transporter ATP-binding protein
VSALLEVRDLAISIGGRELVSSVEFSLGAGECVGVVGETGSGKTLSCRAITGTLQRVGGTVTRGSVTFDGVDLARASGRTWRALRGRRIALMPQSSLSGLDPVMRVGAQLIETVRHLDGCDRPRRRAFELLEQVQLTDPERVFASFPHQLSGGMRQRVMIALAIAGNPDLLVADEPTTALDVTVQRGILDLLAALRSETGMSLILVTHDLAVVEAMSHRIAVVYAGVTVEKGRTARVLEHSTHPYTRALLVARPSALAQGGRLQGIPGAPPSAEHWPSGCRFAPRCDHALAVCELRQPPLEPSGDDRASACVRHQELYS